jgi:hypothetical protein
LHSSRHMPSSRFATVLVPIERRCSCRRGWVLKLSRPAALGWVDRRHRGKSFLSRVGAALPWSRRYHQPRPE